MAKLSDILNKKGRSLGEKPHRQNQERRGGQMQPPPEPTSSVPGPRLESDYFTPSAPGGDDQELRERLVSLYAPSSPQGKRIDILRSQLLYPFHGDPPRTIMITSSIPREGRSILTANLAISFARGLQQYALVLDCNMVQPTIHKLLGVSRRPGLSDFLEHDATVPEIIHRTTVNTLSVIPAGSPSHRSAEILATDKMAQMMIELRERYSDRYMILDTPPVQAFDDPSILARMVEGIVYVVMSGSTDREVVQRGIRSLPEDKIIGIVMNDRYHSVMDGGNVSTGGELEAI